jgi:nitroreductase
MRPSQSASHNDNIAPALHCRLPKEFMNTRAARHPILPLILDRWSPRAYDSSAHVSRPELAALFEAARWAPSSFNVQPWRFVFALRADAGWQAMLDLLIPFNRSWAEAAGALVSAYARSDATGGRVADPRT